MSAEGTEVMEGQRGSHRESRGQPSGGGAKGEADTLPHLPLFPHLINPTSNC